MCALCGMGACVCASEATVPLEATVDPIAWKTELARVTPRLRVRV